MRMNFIKFCSVLIFLLIYNSYSSFGQCLSISTTVQNVSCFGGNDGKINLSITPGGVPNAQPPYAITLNYVDSFGGKTILASYSNVSFTTITFTPGNGSLNIPGADAFGIPANGSDLGYEVTVIATGGSFICRNKTIASIQVTEPSAALTANLVSVDPDCNPLTGAGTGNININTTGGTSPYTFLWTDGAASEDRTLLDAGSYHLDVTDSKLCKTSIDVVVPVVTQANAGSDQIVCADNTVLAGNSAGVGEVGTWTVVAGTGVFSNANSPTTSVGSLSLGNNQFKWTITDSGGICIGTSSIVNVDRNTPASVDAGPVIAICSGSTATMAGTFGGSATSATWSKPGGADGSFNNTALPNAVYTPGPADIAAGSVILTYTTNDPLGPCPAVSDVMTLTINPLPTVSAGIDQTICANATATLAATFGGAATGVMWSKPVTADGSFSNATDPNAVYTPGPTDILNGSVILTVTTDDPAGPCVAATDNMLLKFDQVPTVSAAGPDQTQCNSGNFTLAGNAPAVGVGAWTIIGAANGAAITTPSSATSAVTGLTLGNSVTLRWTISNGTCPPSTDDVVLKNDAVPTTSAAGPDQTQCNNGNFTLAANVPATGVGAWSIVGAANGAVITTPASATSTVTGLTIGNSVTLRWTISNGSCPSSTDDVVLKNDAPPTVSAAGPDQTQCNSGNFTLAGNAPGTGVGAWSVIGAANGAVITTPASATSTVTGLTAGSSVTLRWTITNGTCTSTDDVILTNDATPTASAAGPDQTKCNNGNFTLAANVPAKGVGAWSIVGAANGAVITTPASATSTVTGLTVGNSVTLRWTISNASCPSSTDDVVLKNDSPPTTSAAGPDQTQCNSGNFTLAGNAPVTGVGTWTIVGAANGAVITTPASNTSTVTGLTSGTSVTLRWTITNGTCTSTDNVVLRNNALPTTSAAGPDQTQCNNGNFTLAANVPATGVGAWTIVGAANGAVITTPASATSTVTGLTVGNSVTLRWTISNGVCTSSTDNVVLKNDSPPTTSAAGPDQTQCNNGNFTLAGNAPVTGAGAWSIVGAANGAVITTPASATSTVTGLTIGTSVTLRWTITSGTCTSTDDVVLTNDIAPTTSVAGPDQSQCNNGNFTLAGNVPVTGSGTWSIIGAANGAVITTPASATSTVTGLTVGNNVVLRWTIANGTCTSTDDVTLTNDAPPTTSVAGADQSQCNNGNFTLAGNAPVTGVGAWSIVGAANGAVITTPASATSTVTGLTIGTSVTLRWTITSGTCTSTDDVVLTNDDVPTTSVAGPDQSQCNSGNFTLAGNVPVTGSGTWSIIGAANGAVITTPASATSTVTGLTVGNSVVLRWTIANGTCTSTDDVTLTNDAPPTTSVAGADQSQCNNGNFTLAGNAPVTGAGAWSIVGAANGAVITTPVSATSTVTGLTIGTSVTLRWTITSGTCTSTDDVVLTNDDVPTTSVAGPDQSQCNNGNFTLAGNVPVIGSGTWSIIGAANGAVVTTPASATSTVTGLTVGTSVTLRWTVTNGACPSSTDDVVLTNDNPPITSVAGADQAQCNDGNFTLAGNNPGAGTGIWSIVGAANGAVITAPASATSTVTGLTVGTSVTLRWTITSGTCTSTDDVVLSNDAAPTTAVAGPDQSQCNSGNFTLAGNVPVIGVGTWSIVGAANGAVITTPASEVSTVTGLTAGNSVTLRWTINSSCASSTDDVVLTNDNVPTTSAAGADQAQCGNGNFTLAANTPVTGIGAWSIVGAANGAVITTPASATSTVTGLTVGTSVTLQWTITNGTCTSTDDVILTNDDAPSVSAAGADQSQCNDGNFTLAATIPVTGTAAWSIVGAANGAVITTPTSEVSTVTGLTIGTSVTLRWTITNGTCTSTDDVVLTNDALVTVSAAGPDQSNVCGTATLAANAPVAGVGAWSFAPGGNPDGLGNFIDTTDPASGFNGTPGQTYTLRWTITGGSCSSFDDVQIQFDITGPTASNAGSDQAQCTNGNFTLAANVPVVGVGSWSIVGAANGAVITTPASEVSTVTGLTLGFSVTLRWTITSGACSSFDDVVLSNDDVPTAAAAGTDQLQCGNGNFTLAANLPVTGVGAWSIVGAANGAIITTPTSEVSTVTGLTAGTNVTLRWTITNGACSSTDDIVLTNDIAPTTSVAGADQSQCNNGDFTLAANAPAVGTGAWSIVGTANGAVITTPASEVSTVTGLTVGTSVTLRWTITNGTCISTDDVTLTNDDVPSVSAAGADQSQCNNGNFTLAANLPVTGTGIWTIIGPSNGASITTPTSEVSTVTGLTVGNSVTLRWTTTNGTCTSTDDVVLTNDAAVTASAAGPDQSNICGTATLAANAPVAGVGQWSFAPGGNPDGLGNFIDTTNPASGFNGTPGQTYILRWTITGGTCTSADDVQIQFDITGPTAANAGTDQSQCGSGDFTLAGNIPLAGTGTWTIIGAANGAVITTPTSEVSTVTSLAAGTSVTLRWTINNGICSSFDDVVLTNDNAPTAPLAGTDQVQCNNGNFTLAGNTPLVGTGTWSIVGAANGAVITTPTSEVSTVTGLTVGNSVTLRWTIANGACSNADDVTLTNSSPVTAAAAGPDQAICTATATLAANAPVSGVGAWSIISGLGGAFTDSTNPTTTFTGTSGVTYVLQWDITSTCGNSQDQVTIKINTLPTTANAGPDQILCGPVAVTTLAANTPGVGETGTWIITPSTGAVLTPGSPTSQFVGSLGTSYALKWVISNGTCAPSIDDLVINFAASPTSASPVTACVNTAAPTLTAAAVGATSIEWYTDAALTNLVFTGGSYTPAAAQLNMGTVASTSFYVIARYACGASPSTQVVVNVSNTGACGGGGGANCFAFAASDPVIEVRPSCSNQNDGQLIFGVKGGSGAYVVTLYDSLSTPIFTQSKIGSSAAPISFASLSPSLNYFYKIDDGTNTCVLPYSLPIKTTVKVSVTGLVNAICFGDSTGRATLTVTGGNSPYEYSIDGGATWVTNFVSGNEIGSLPPNGTYNILVRDDASDLCPAEVPVTITNANPKLKASFTTSPSSCNGNDGTVTNLVGSGGIPPTYTFLIDGNPSPFDKLGGGSHTLTISDGTCSMDSVFDITFPGFINFTVGTPVGSSCGSNNKYDGVLPVSFPVVGTYKVGVNTSQTVEPTAYATFTTQAVNDVLTIDTLARGTYYVWVKKTGVECPTRKGPFVVDGPYPINFDFEPICINGQVSLKLNNVTADPSISSGAISITVYDLLDNPIVNGVQLGSYSPSYILKADDPIYSVFLQNPGRYKIRLDQLQFPIGCAMTNTKSYTVNSPLSAQIKTSLIAPVTPSASYPDEPTGAFDVINFVGGQAPYKISLALETPTVPGQSFTPLTDEDVSKNDNLQFEKDYNELPAGVYNVIVTDSIGCSIELVAVVPLDLSIFVPNIFTPNDDAINDKFFIRNLSANSKLTISNRWGKEVFSTKDYQNDWKGDGVEDGIYYYRLETDSGVVKGWVEVLRGNKP